MTATRATAEVREAVILAAGRGIRLAALGEQIPKGFIRLGEKPIVEESIERLRAAGIARIVVVTGHLPEFYEALARRFPGLVETVHNDAFADTGSLRSLLAAAGRVTGDFLLLESDILYEPRALAAVLRHAARDVLLLSGATHSGDEVWVESDGHGMLRRMSKDRAALGEVAGELVGITRLSAGCFRVLLAEAEPLLARLPKADYESGLVAAAALHPILCHRVQDLVWGEIDDERHLLRAASLVYPLIGRR
jgi:2-aminoethylphosphonate-pyruvate transaminase